MVKLNQRAKYVG